jgi:hypothetical protein
MFHICTEHCILSYTVIVFARSSERAPNSFEFEFEFLFPPSRRGEQHQDQQPMRSAQGYKFIILCISLKVDETNTSRFLCECQLTFFFPYSSSEYQPLQQRVSFHSIHLFQLSLADRQPYLAFALHSYLRSPTKEKQYLVGLTIGVQPHQA